MNTRVKRSWIKISIIVLIVVMGVEVYVNTPVNSFTLDVNPSIEIISNRLHKVIAVNPLNEDAKILLNDYKLRNKDLEKVIDDIVDRMILNGYLSIGKDNAMTITVADMAARQEYVEKVNEIISTYLETKQIEVLVLTNSLAAVSVESEISKVKSIATTDDNVVASNVDAVTAATELDSSQLISQLDSSQLISQDEAEKIALGFVNGEVLKIKLDNDDGQRVKYEIEVRFEGQKYEIELDAYTGDILKFDKDDKADNDDIPDITIRQLISQQEAEKIALGLVNGKIIIFKLDDDDRMPKYEIEVKFEGHKYEIEIDAYTGILMKFDKDDDDDRIEQPMTITNQLIGKEAAEKIALQLVNGKIIKFELNEDDDDNGKDAEYEIEIRFEGRKYEVEIDAYTGKVLEFEKDDDDDDDDDDEDDEDEDDDEDDEDDEDEDEDN